jgi:membrane protein DedA with SNARE-associated domain
MLEWLEALPAPLLYLITALAAFAENVFPPVPADTVIALSAYIAGRGVTSPIGAWLATMLGNLSGALTMYLLGRRFGAPWIARRLPALGGPAAEERVRRQYERHGVWALAVSRFIPAVRALVPPLAGALGIGLGRAMLAMSAASALWYGLISWLAVTAADNTEALLATIANSQRVAAVGAVSVLIGALLLWRWKR